MSHLVKCTIVTPEPIELLLDRDSQLFGFCALGNNWLGLEYPFVAGKESTLEIVVCLLLTDIRHDILDHY